MHYVELLQTAPLVLVTNENCNS